MEALMPKSHSSGRLEYSGDPADFADHFLECRANGRYHPFLPVRHYDELRVGRRLVGYSRTRECPLCGVKKTEHFDKEMFLVGPAHYERPEGYLKPRGEGVPLTPAAARQEQLRRQRRVGRRLRAV